MLKVKRIHLFRLEKATFLHLIVDGTYTSRSEPRDLQKTIRDGLARGTHDYTSRAISMDQSLNTQ